MYMFETSMDLETENLDFIKLKTLKNRHLHLIFRNCFQGYAFYTQLYFVAIGPGQPVEDAAVHGEAGDDRSDPPRVRPGASRAAGQEHHLAVLLGPQRPGEVLHARYATLLKGRPIPSRSVEWFAYRHGATCAMYSAQPAQPSRQQ